MAEINRYYVRGRDVSFLRARILTLPVAFLLFVVAAVFWTRRSGSLDKPVAAKATKIRNVPLRIEPVAPLLFARDSPEAACINRILQEAPSGPLNVSYCCHLLRLYGLDSFRHPRFASGREVVRALADQDLSKTYFGEPIFVETRSGIRYRDPGTQEVLNGENHRDLCLATFAELGLPLSTEFRTASRVFSLSDLLRDSVENFHLKQNELPWTAVAYALYLGPVPHWTNRFKETFTWDQLTETLLEVPFTRGSCGGTHLLYALTIIHRVQGPERPLSNSVRLRLDQRLKSVIALACASQQADGHWTADWCADRNSSEFRHSPTGDSAFTRLLITGHLLECLTFAPPEFQPPAELYRRAARWLCRSLEDNRVDTVLSMCPRTHAIRGVRNLIEPHGN